jgi:putative transcriptional regulator
MTGIRTSERYPAVDTVAVRESTGLSQAEFARTFRIKLDTLQAWEQKRRRPRRSSVVLLKMIEVDADGVQRILAKVR